MGFGGHGGHSHSDSHSHSHHDHGNKKKGCSCTKTIRLSMMLTMTFGFFVVELVVGEITNSITLTADAFHMLSDVIALCIGLFSVRIAKRKTSKNTFGWVRAEVLGALVNAVFLVSLCVSIVIEAIKRLIETDPIKEVDLLLYVACTGLAINLIGLVIFGHGHSHSVPPEAVKELRELEEVELNMELDDIKVNGHNHSHNDDDDDDECDGHSHDNNNHNANSEEVSVSLVNNNMNKTAQNTIIKLKDANDAIMKKKSCCHIFSSEANLNIRGVFLHVLADALGSVMAIINALVNKYNKELHIPPTVIKFVDPVLSLILIALILASTIPLFKETALILLQTVPKDIKLNQLKEELNKVKGILSVHELHIWKLSGNKIIASAHITCHSLEEYMQIAARVKILFHEKGIHSTTIQPEFVDPIDDNTKKDCMLECKTTCTENTCCGQSSNGLRVRTQPLQQSQTNQQQETSIINKNPS